MSRRFNRLLVLPIALLGVVVVTACEDDPAETRGGEISGREETRQVLEELRTELARDAGEVTPERKEALLERCVRALERIRADDQEGAGLLDDWCDSLEDTNPNTPAVWDELRRGLDKLIEQQRDQ